MIGLKRDDEALRRFRSEIDPRLEFEAKKFADLLRYWNTKRGRRIMPARVEMDPLELKDHLGRICLIDIEEAPFRLRFRLIGATITAILRRDMTGRYFDDLYSDSLLDELTTIYRQTARDRSPLRFHGRALYPNGRHYRYEALNLPLSDDGVTANVILTAMNFTEIPRS